MCHSSGGQAVSRWLPTVAARVEARVRSCGGRSGMAAGFLRVLRFTLPNIPQDVSHSSPSAIGQMVADVPIGLSQPTP
jgi:hypothetical protein